MATQIFIIFTPNLGEMIQFHEHIFFRWVVRWMFIPLSAGKPEAHEIPYGFRTFFRSFRLTPISWKKLFTSNIQPPKIWKNILPQPKNNTPLPTTKKAENRKKHPANLKKKTFYNQKTPFQIQKKKHIPTHRDKHTPWVGWKTLSAETMSFSGNLCQASNHLRLSFSLAPAGDLSFRVAGRLKKKHHPKNFGE